MAERVFLRGFSKAYAMTGFRIGYACGPAELIDAMMRIHQYSMLCANIVGQDAAIKTLENGAGPAGEMKEQFRLRHYIVDAYNAWGWTAIFRAARFTPSPACSRPTSSASLPPTCDGGKRGLCSRQRIRRAGRGFPALLLCHRP